MNNTLIPIIVNGYFDEKVSEVYEYKDNKFTFLSNVDDSIKYIFEEIYITEGESSVIIHEDDTSIPLRIESNVTNFLISLTINNTVNTRLQVIYSPLSYKNNFKIGDIISYIATKSGYFSLTDSLTIANNTPTISLEFVSDGTGNPETTINARVGFKSNSIGTVITLTYTDTSEIEHTETKTTQSSTGIIYFNLTNPQQVSYTAVAGGVTKNDTFTFTEGERIITLTFDTGQGTDIGGNTSGGGGGGGTSNVPVTGINIIPTSLTLHVGDTYQLEAEVLPINASNKTVYWSIMNEGQSTYEELEPDIPIDNVSFLVNGKGQSFWYNGNFTDTQATMYNMSEWPHHPPYNLTHAKRFEIHESGDSFDYYIKTNLPTPTVISAYGQDIIISKTYDQSFQETNIHNNPITVYNDEYGENNKITIKFPEWDHIAKRVFVLFRNDYNDTPYTFVIQCTYVPDDEYNANGNIKPIGFEAEDRFYNNVEKQIQVTVTANCKYTFNCRYYKEKTNQPGQYDTITLYTKTDDAGTHNITVTLPAIENRRTYTLSLIYTTNEGKVKTLDEFDIHSFGNELSGTIDLRDLLQTDIISRWEDGTHPSKYWADELDINFTVFSAIGPYRIYTTDNWFTFTSDITGDTGYKIFNIHCTENITGENRMGSFIVETTGTIHAKITQYFTQQGDHVDTYNGIPYDRYLGSPAKMILDKNESSKTLIIRTNSDSSHLIKIGGDGFDCEITNITPNKIQPGTTSVTVNIKNYNRSDDFYMNQGFNTSLYFGAIGFSIVVRRLPNWKLTDKEFIIR